MMEMLQGWLLGLTAAALAVSLLTAMLPKGETIRRIAGLAGGLILLLAVVQPLLRVRWEELTWRYETYQREMDRQTEAYQAAYADSLSGDIADRTAAYISEKAASLGIDCRVQRDTEYGQGKTGAQQSRFIDPEVDGYGPDGAPARLDPPGPTAVGRQGTRETGGKAPSCVSYTAPRRGANASPAVGRAGAGDAGGWHGGG